jgi:hypothetical protein
MKKLVSLDAAQKKSLAESLVMEAVFKRTCEREGIAMLTSTVVYINSFTRSGSTLLGMLLATQRDITYIGEVRNLKETFDEKGMCFCGSLLAKCPFWSDVLNRIQKDIMYLETKTSPNLARKLIKYLSLVNCPVWFLRLTGFFSLSVRKEIQVIENILSVYDAASYVSRGNIICDSSKLNTEAKLLWMFCRERIKIIHLVRDGRGVVNSIRKRKGSAVNETASMWKKNYYFTLLTHAGIPSKNILFTRYEDLCTYTEKEIQRICNFIGIQFSPKALLEKKEWHFVGGSPTIKNNRLRSISLDEGWKTELSKEDQDEFERIAGKVNQKCGYE